MLLHAERRLGFRELSSCDHFALTICPQWRGAKKKTLYFIIVPWEQEESSELTSGK